MEGLERPKLIGGGRATGCSRRLEERMNVKRELLTRLKEISSEHLGVPQENITEECTWTQLGADSLDRLEMSRVIEAAFKVEIPHSVGERLNTVGKTLDHLVSLTKARREIPGIRIETATSSQQWAEMLDIRTQVFTKEYGLSVRPLPGPGEAGVWHFLARDNEDAIGTLSIVDTSEDYQARRRYRLGCGRDDRVARFAHLAILRPYRGRGVITMLIETAQNTIIRPNRFAVSWLLYPAANGHPSMITRCFGFFVNGPTFSTEFGKCYVLIRREPSLEQDHWTTEPLVVEVCPI
jgi:acyl carrier protein